MERNLLNKILDAYDDNDFLVAEGFDDAVIGVDSNSMRLVYSVSKCVDILMSRDNMSREDAIEYFNYNTCIGYVGDKTPIYCDDYF